MRPDAQPRGRGCRAQVVEDGLVGVEGTPRPVLADLAEEAMLDGVPLGGARRVGGDGHAEAVVVAQLGLQPVLPGAAVGAVAATAVGQDREFAGVAIPSLAFAPPPPRDAVHSELGGVVGGPDKHGAPVGLYVVDAVGDGDADGLGAEVMVVHEYRLTAPGDARVLETS